MESAEQAARALDRFEGLEPKVQADWESYTQAIGQWEQDLAVARVVGLEAPAKPEEPVSPGTFGAEIRRKRAAHRDALANLEAVRASLDRKITRGARHQLELIHSRQLEAVEALESAIQEERELAKRLADGGSRLMTEAMDRPGSPFRCLARASRIVRSLVVPRGRVRPHLGAGEQRSRRLDTTHHCKTAVAGDFELKTVVEGALEFGRVRDMYDQVWSTPRASQPSQVEYMMGRCEAAIVRALAAALACSEATAELLPAEIDLMTSGQNT